MSINEKIKNYKLMQQKDQIEPINEINNQIKLVLKDNAIECICTLDPDAKGKYAYLGSVVYSSTNLVYDLMSTSLSEELQAAGKESRNNIIAKNYETGLYASNIKPATFNKLYQTLKYLSDDLNIDISKIETKNLKTTERNDIVIVVDEFNQLDKKDVKFTGAKIKSLIQGAFSPMTKPLIPELALPHQPINSELYEKIKRYNAGMLEFLAQTNKNINEGCVENFVAPIISKEEAEELEI